MTDMTPGQDDAPRFEIHHEPNGWAALYIDGNLVTVGDAYHAEEIALERLGVKVVHDDTFMRGQHHRGCVAHTLDEIDAYRRQCADAKAAAIRAQIEQLAAEAEALEAQ